MSGGKRRTVTLKRMKFTGNTPRHTDQNRTSRRAPNVYAAIPATTREAISDHP